MKIYTRKGDNGTTGLFGGLRVSKSDLRVESYGTIDELNSHLGILRHGANSGVQEHITIIQNTLFNIGSYLAAAENAHSHLPILDKTEIPEMEKWIDNYTSSLPALKHFILPGGSFLGSHAHIARCVCRRAERLCVALNSHSKIEPFILTYLNRLSDLLFVIARHLDNEGKAKEVLWYPNVKELKK